MKKYFLIIAIAISQAATAQVTKVYLKASGLTCSMCSNSINKALKTLDFVENVEADIKTYTFEVSFKENATVDFDKIKNKVEGAGFSVSGFIAFINFNNVQVKTNEPVRIGDKTFLFVNIKAQSLNGFKEVKVLNRGFISSKEFKKMSFPVLSSGTFHAAI